MVHVSRIMTVSTIPPKKRSREGWGRPAQWLVSMPSDTSPPHRSSSTVNLCAHLALYFCQFSRSYFHTPAISALLGVGSASFSARRGAGFDPQSTTQGSMVPQTPGTDWRGKLRHRNLPTMLEMSQCTLKGESLFTASLKQEVSANTPMCRSRRQAAHLAPDHPAHGYLQTS